AALFITVGFVVSAELMAANADRPSSVVAAPIDASERLEPRLLEAPVESSGMSGERASLDAILDLMTAIENAGEAGRRVVVAGAARNVGTTLTALALARALVEHKRVVIIDLALAHPNLAAVAVDAAGPGIADLV